LVCIISAERGILGVVVRGEGDLNVEQKEMVSGDGRQDCFYLIPEEL
jgi:hypothetical protein